ncbi:N-acetyl-gamma-glutamyl-phosphate reductase [Virgibacillus sp. W0181]|uniref:N-acetyl-gamma-glutamyl-phosphate reductase n=1 Tax=Virgibacillus sp. W0181 TaxID=3391581 RepID=UPI003F46DE77
MKVAIIGATGYGGAELVRILHNHPNVSIHSIHATSLLGEQIQASYPHMQNVVDLQLDSVDAEKLASQVDLVFTATPSGVSAKLAPVFLEQNVKVIDLSGDFRITDRQAYEAWYGLEAADENLLNQAIYGLTEWLDGDVSDAKLIANPGCYPTAVLLGLAPLAKQKMIDEKTIIIDAKTGVSGAGRGVSGATHFAETNENLKIYKVNAHQHTAEIEQLLHRWNENIDVVTFSTHLVPMTRGIMSTMYATATNEVTTEQLFNLYKESYQDHPFVRIRKQGTYPSTKEVYGSNFCDISLTYDQRTNRIMVVSVIDNLIKGASGQAVQNMNKMIQLDEKTGLDFMPVYP